MYICLDCDEVFEKPRYSVHHTFCPFCGNADIWAAVQCRECGDYDIEPNIVDGLCTGCYPAMQGNLVYYGGLNYV
jgi:predicted RNA-binding Zn-ribbon protein involved in translation (DUF1610 family)